MKLYVTLLLALSFAATPALAAETATTAPTVVVTTDAQTYGALDAAQNGIHGLVSATDATGEAADNATLRVSILQRAPVVGFVRGESFTGTTDAAGQFAFEASDAFRLPGTYLVIAWVTIDGVEYSGQTTYTVGAV